MAHIPKHCRKKIYIFSSIALLNSEAILQVLKHNIFAWLIPQFHNSFPSTRNIFRQVCNFRISRILVNAESSKQAQSTLFLQLLVEWTREYGRDCLNNSPLFVHVQLRIYMRAVTLVHCGIWTPFEIYSQHWTINRLCGWWGDEMGVLSCW